jgi:RNA polymerase sigma factor (sigma-70 family)
MDDREIVAAIAAGDLTGLANAYDKYAESLYGYSRWMLGDPDDAAAALQDTFIVAAGQVGALSDPRKLRPWLYAVARNECHRRLDTTDAEPGAAEPGESLADTNGGDGRAELRQVVRAALARLAPEEREVLELSLRHDLSGADLAAVLGISRKQTHALAVRARDRLDKALAALIVGRTGRQACPVLDMLLTDWDGRLTVFMSRRIIRHMRHCETCDNRRRGALRPAALSGMTPLAALPNGLRDEILGLCSDHDPEVLAYRGEVTYGAGPFRPNGFPEAISPPGKRMLALSRVAVAACVLVAVAATGVTAALALSGSHPNRPVAAGRSSDPTTASAATSGTYTPAVPSTPASPTSQSPTTSASPVMAVSSAASPTAKPSPTHSATASSTPTPSPSETAQSATPTPSATATVTPTSTPTASPSTSFPQP